MAEDPRNKIAVGVVLENGGVEWFDGPPAENTFLFIRYYTQEDIDAIGKKAEEYRSFFEAKDPD